MGMIMVTEPRKQPEPVDIGEVMIAEKGIMYSAMHIGQLMKLRSFIDDLIKWKAAGNPCHIGTLTCIVTQKLPENTEGGA